MAPSPWADFSQDSGDSTLTFGIEKEDGAEKDEPAHITLTWHRDDLEIRTD